MRNQHSYSELLAFNTCGKKWQTRYQSKIYPLEISDSMVMGTAFHAGLQEYVVSRDEGKAKSVAAYALEKECKDLAHSDAIKDKVFPSLEYHLPRVDPEHRYKPMTEAEVFDMDKPQSSHEVPMIEYRFQHDKFFGYVDAVLWDSKLEEQVLVDYKLRRAINTSTKIEIDSQLPFYASVLNRMGANISQAIMWQFRVQPPAIARTKQTGRGKSKRETMSDAAQSTTWSYWVETLPDWFNENLMTWRKKLEGKLKPDTFFMSKTYTSLDHHLLASVYEDKLNTVHMMSMVRDYVSSGGKLPGLLSGWGCGNCDYLNLCTAEIHGKDKREILKNEFYVRS